MAGTIVRGSHWTGKPFSNILIVFIYFRIKGGNSGLNYEFETEDTVNPERLRLLSK